MTRGLRMASILGGLGALLISGGVGCRNAGTPRPPQAAAGADSAAADSGAVTDSATAVFSAAALPIPDLGYTARQGRAVYRHYCLNCHGDGGKGDGFNAYNLDPRPRSLADSTFQAGRTDADLLTAIRSGGSAVGLSTGMPPWGRTLNERQMYDVVEYIRMFAKAEPAPR